VLVAIEGQYDVLVTLDRSIPYQQDIAGWRLAVAGAPAFTAKSIQGGPSPDKKTALLVTGTIGFGPHGVY
jgi:hypothetical protein